MKSFVAIFFLSVLTFNWVGYQLITSVFERQSDIHLDATIEEATYDQADLVEMRVPLNAPYLVNRSGAFERCAGEVTIGDTDYNYVMRKIDGNELVLLCLPNEEKSRIRNLRTEFFKLVNDLNNSTHGKEKQGSSVFKSFTALYRAENNCWSVERLDRQLQLRSGPDKNAVRLAGFHHIHKQPPRAWLRDA